MLLNKKEDDPKVILQRMQSLLEYTLAGIARSKIGLLSHPLYLYGCGESYRCCQSLLLFDQYLFSVHDVNTALVDVR